MPFCTVCEPCSVCTPRSAAGDVSRSWAGRISFARPSAPRRAAFCPIIKITSKKYFQGAKKAPRTVRGAIFPIFFARQSERPSARKIRKTFFSHPDYTVGTGIAPVQRSAENRAPHAMRTACFGIPVADYTAGGESHPAPKNRFVAVSILPPRRFVNRSACRFSARPSLFSQNFIKPLKRHEILTLSVSERYFFDK